MTAPMKERLGRAAFMHGFLASSVLQAAAKLRKVLETDPDDPEGKPRARTEGELRLVIEMVADDLDHAEDSAERALAMIEERETPAKRRKKRGTDAQP